MRAYDPDQAPDPPQWLVLDEQLRIDLAESFHRLAKIDLSNITAHSTFHVLGRS